MLFLPCFFRFNHLTTRDCAVHHLTMTLDMPPPSEERHEFGRCQYARLRRRVPTRSGKVKIAFFCLVSCTVVYLLRASSINNMIHHLQKIVHTGPRARLASSPSPIESSIFDSEDDAEEGGDHGESDNSSGSKHGKVFIDGDYNITANSRSDIRIHDTILFNDELDLLSIRLGELNATVDFFIIMESRARHCSFRGEPCSGCVLARMSALSLFVRVQSSKVTLDRTGSS